MVIADVKRRFYLLFIHPSVIRRLLEERTDADISFSKVAHELKESYRRQSTQKEEIEALKHALFNSPKPPVPDEYEQAKESTRPMQLGRPTYQHVLREQELKRNRARREAAAEAAKNQKAFK